VQGELERVLGHLYGVPMPVQCAGRTDAGVHARGQVAHVDAPMAATTDIDVRRINRALPADLRILRMEEVSPQFDARFSALWRRYSYRVCDGGVGPDPLARHLVLPWPRWLDVDRMNEAAEPLHGEHDFAPFCKQREFATTVRGLERLRWYRDEAGLAVMDIQADAFCHSMVRSLVGALLPVGDGRRTVDWPGQVLHSGVKDSGVTVMPAYPLVLEQVGYPPPEEWAERQQRTRVRRDT